MKLYHGSNVKVERPIIRNNIRALDFGAGFYLTSEELQAKSWAKTVTRRRREGQATVSLYEFQEDKKVSLKIKRFSEANEEWLDFVVANRKKVMLAENYDIVIGPVANDSTIDVINDYMRGRFSKEIAVQLLLPQNLTDQYAFLTMEALECLTYEGSHVV